MRNFVINLPQSTDRKQNVEQQLSQLNIAPHFFSAVNGARLSKEELDNNVVETNYLSKGEIGCALSHLHIYKTMIEENIPYALIFEDDIVLSTDFTPDILSELELFMQEMPEDQPCAVLLYDSGFKRKVVKQLSSTLSINKTVNAFTTHAYMINLQAAKNILAIQSPVKFEIDAWKHYVYLDKLSLYCVTPSLVLQDIEIDSIIEEQKGRDFADKNRKKLKKYNFNLVFKKLPLKTKIKTYLFRLYKNLSF